ncbi:MAG TPA: cupin domain-containing protein [Verrucomicrobiae bacterium]|nr:cupin domain-containing protein [Verrucomicrobiae bacterium]
MLEKYLSQHDLQLADIEAAKKESRVYAHKPDFTWDGVEVIRYKPEGDDWAGIVRQVIIGYREQTGFHVRYFEISPGGHSSLEKHEHSHAVTVVRGTGKCILGERAVELGFLDTVYVSPDCPHQFINDGEEPFGFLCVVDADRDRPRALDEAELARLEQDPVTGNIVKSKKVVMHEQP